MNMRKGNPETAAAARRYGSAGCLILSPILLTLGLVTIPGTSSEHFDNFVGNEGLAQVSAVLLHWAWVILIPGIIGLIPIMRGKGLLLGNLAGAMAVLGLINWSAFLLIDFFDLALLAELDRETAERVEGSLDALSGAAFGILAPGALMTGLGVPLVFVALALSRRVSWLCPALVIIGIGLFMALSTGPLLVRPLGGIVLLAAFAQAAAGLLRSGTDSGPTDPHTAMSAPAGARP
jgi:hypothetical protein